jgi:hypothetical protein
MHKYLKHAGNKSLCLAVDESVEWTDDQHEHGIQNPRDQAQLCLVGRVEAGEVVRSATLVHSVGQASSVLTTTTTR